jgi:hypothetical protein
VLGQLQAPVPSAPAQVDFAVSPTAAVNFGDVNIGSVAGQVFTVQSTRGGTVTGTASAAAPFSIVSGSLFTLAGLGATQNVTCASARQPPRSRARMLVSPQTATLS